MIYFLGHLFQKSLRRRAGKFHITLFMRMCKPDGMGMQGQAREAPFLPVFVIAQYGMTDMAQMHPQLMRAARFRKKVHQGHPLASFDHTVKSHRLLGGIGILHTPLFPVIRVPPQRRIDHAFIKFQLPLGESNVMLLYFMFYYLRLTYKMGFVRAIRSAIFMMRHLNEFK